MTARTQIEFLDLDDPETENRRKIRESAFSRFPVVQGGTQQVIGVVQAKDLLASCLGAQPFDLRAESIGVLEGAGKEDEGTRQGMNSRTIAMWDSAINEGACPQPGISSTRSPRTSIPADHAEANAWTSSKPRSSSKSSITPPTAPVAPTTAILGMSAFRLGRV